MKFLEKKKNKNENDFKVINKKGRKILILIGVSTLLLLAIGLFLIIGVSFGLLSSNDVNINKNIALSGGIIIGISAILSLIVFPIVYYFNLIPFEKSEYYEEVIGEKKSSTQETKDNQAAIITDDETEKKEKDNN